MANSRLAISNSTASTNSNVGGVAGVMTGIVLDVILDESHPEYDKYGRNKCIGGIKYAPVDRRVSTSDTTTLPIAYPLNASIRTLPLVNEIVLISYAPDDKVVTGIENSKLGYSYSHISNNDWGEKNPGTDNQKITFYKNL